MSVRITCGKAKAGDVVGPEREVRKLEKQIKADTARMASDLQQFEKNLEVAAAIDLGQLALAISLGITLSRIENGITLSEKIQNAEHSSDAPPNVMQKALLQQLGWQVEADSTRGEVSYEIIRRVGGKNHKFIASFDSAFQDRFCGGPLTRFNAVPAFSPTTNRILSVFGIGWRIFKFLVIAFIALLTLGILLAIYAPKADKPQGHVPAPKEQSAD